MDWEFEYSIECNVRPELAWKFWTNIENWNDPPAKFDLHGPFEAGTRLTTILPGQTFDSIIRDVQPEREATIELELADATLSFHWKFEKLGEGRSRITQRLRLSGSNADSFVRQARVMETTVPQGMARIAAAIERTERLATGESPKT